MNKTNWAELVRDAVADIRQQGTAYLWAVRLQILFVVAGYMAIIASAIALGLEQLFIAAIVGLIVLVIIIRACVRMAIVWHRRIILDEPFPTAVTNASPAVLGYFGRGILVGIIASLPVMAVGVTLAVFGADTDALDQSVIAQSLFQMVYFVAFATLCIVLPACAVGQPFSIGEAWKRSKGHRGQVAIAFFAANFPLTILQKLMSWYGDAADAPGLLFVIGAIAGMILSILIGWVSLSIMTRAYIAIAQDASEPAIAKVD